MPSDALVAWQTKRMPRLQMVEADCLHLEALHAADPSRVQVFIRSYAVLLSAEFQGFCRHLHDKCADGLVDSVNPLALQDVLRSQCVHRRKLDTGNANPDNLRDDFNRYQLDFWAAVLAVDPGHAARKSRLGMLNAWRNAIAHHDYDPAELGGTTTLTLPQVGAWRTDCDVLATAFDAVVRKHLEDNTGVYPWPP